MPDFNPASASPILILAVIFALATIGGFLPFSPIEPALLMTAVARPALILPCVLLATVSQMSAKTLLFVGSRRVEAQLSDRKRRVIDRVRRRLEGRRWTQVVTVLLSALAGFPPLYAVTVVCAVLRLRLSHFVVAGTVGRGIRFSILALLPQLFT